MSTSHPHTFPPTHNPHTTHARAAPHPPAPATQHSILSCRLSRQTKPHQKRAVPDPAPLAVDEIDGPPARWCRLSAINCWCSGKVELYVRWRHRFITFEFVVVQLRTRSYATPIGTAAAPNAPLQRQTHRWSAKRTAGAPNAPLERQTHRWSAKRTAAMPNAPAVAPNAPGRF